MTPQQSAIIEAACSFISSSNTKLLIGNAVGNCDRMNNLTSDDLDEVLRLPPGTLLDAVESPVRSVQYVILRSQRTQVCRAGGCAKCCEQTEPTLAWAVFGMHLGKPLSESVYEVIRNAQGAGGFLVYFEDLKTHWSRYFSGDSNMSVHLHEASGIASVFLNHSMLYQHHNPFCPGPSNSRWRDIPCKNL